MLTFCVTLPSPTRRRRLPAAAGCLHEPPPSCPSVDRSLRRLPLALLIQAHARKDRADGAGQSLSIVAGVQGLDVCASVADRRFSYDYLRVNCCGLLSAQKIWWRLKTRPPKSGFLAPSSVVLGGRGQRHAAEGMAIGYPAAIVALRRVSMSGGHILHRRLV